MDLFISYRRTGGGVWANLLHTKLAALGIKIFYDKHKIENENFEVKIKKSLRRSPNVLLILSPGIFAFQERTETDWVLEEIEYALQEHKNLILVQVDGFDIHADMRYDHPVVHQLSMFNMLQYNNDTPAKEEASIMDIVGKMRDAKGGPFTLGERITQNSWYTNYEMTDEDMLWIKTDYEVCHKWDQRMLRRICQEPVMQHKDNISLFCIKSYDVDTYALKYSVTDPDTGLPLISNVYGTTYESDLPKADALFGKGHFVADTDSEHIVEEMHQVLRQNNLRGFDIIDMTLFIKDLNHPEKVVREMAKALNPDGGVLLIRELDDDFVKAYPHEDIIDHLVKLLELDPGAGNRHTGKKIYTYLMRSGADKVYISDEIISTANHKAKYQELICQTYFSYLKPELRNLAKEEPDTYLDAYNWIEKHYERIENLFCSPEFYFRAGYISGYGVFEADED